MPDESRSKAPLIAAVVVAIGALGVGGYFLQGKLKCDRLSDEYLNGIDDYQRSAVIGTLLPTTRDQKNEREQLQQLQLKLLSMRLTSIYEECGERAGDNATRQSSQLLNDAL